MNSIARRTRSQISGWNILPPAVACSRRKHAGVPYCSTSRKSKGTEEVILLSEEEEGSDHVGKFKTRKRGLNVWKGNTEEDHNGDEMRKFARKHGCSSSSKGRRQSEASSRGSRRIQRTKRAKKGATELMSSGDDNGSTEVEEPAKRPLIQVKKVKKIASGNLSSVGKRREKASNKFNYVKKKRNFQRRKDEDKESISTSDDVDNNVTDVDYVDDEEGDVNLKERSTSRLRSCQEGRDSKVMKGGTLHFFQRKKQKEIIDLVSSEDDDNTKQFKTKGKKTGSLGSQTGIRKTKENIPEKGRSSETMEESVGGRKDARRRDEENEGVSRNRVSREYANKRGSLGKKVKEEETQSLSFNIEEEEEEEKA